MALDNIIVDGDLIQFNPKFGLATVVVKPGQIKASGKTKVKGKKVCIQGDEKSVVVACAYSVIPDFPIPGMGNLKIDSLASNQCTKKSKSGKKPMLLKGSVFNALFEVTLPAKLVTPTSTKLDKFPSSYEGTGKLKPSTTTIKAT